MSINQSTRVSLVRVRSKKNYNSSNFNEFGTVMSTTISKIIYIWMNTDYCSLQSPNQFDLWIFYIKLCNNFVMTSGSKSYAYCLIWQIHWAQSFAVQFPFLPKTLCFRIDEKAKMVLAFGAFGEFNNFGKKSNHYISSIFFFCSNSCIFEKLRNLDKFIFWENLS